MPNLTEAQKKDLNKIQLLLAALDRASYQDSLWALHEAAARQHLKMLEARGDVVRAVRKLEAVMATYPRFLPDDLRE